MSQTTPWIDVFAQQQLQEVTIALFQQTIRSWNQFF